MSFSQNKNSVTRFAGEDLFVSGCLPYDAACAKEHAFSFFDCTPASQGSQVMVSSDLSGMAGVYGVSGVADLSDLSGVAGVYGVSGLSDLSGVAGVYGFLKNKTRAYDIGILCRRLLFCF